MAHDEAVVTQKFGKAASPPKDQPTLYPHPDWSTVQAYYGPGVFPPTYFAPAIAPGHAPPPYMWGPQPLMPPPFGAPYAAMYPHGGGYPHPLVPLMANPLTAEPAKSANNKEKSPNKKLKEIDGSAVSTGSGSSKIASGDYSAEGSIDGSDLKVTKTSNNQSLEDGLGADVEQNNAAKMEDVPAPNNTVGDPGKPASSSNPCFPSPLIKPHAANVCNVRAMVTPISTSPGGMVPGRNGVSTELTKDERELKRERRKQSNRESARRSRLRKQAETEELAMKVDSLIAENTSLRSEISRLTESSEKLRLENSALMEKLKDAAPSHAKAALGKVSVPSPVVMEKFLSIIEHKNTSGIGGHMEHGEPKLHQLLGSSPAADAVAAN